MTAATLALGLSVAAVGCSAGGPESSVEEAADAGGGEVSDKDGAAAAKEQADAGSPVSVLPVDSPEQAMIARDATVSVLVEDVAAAAAQVRAAGASADGYVASEDLDPGTADRAGYATIVLSVPSDRLDGALESLGDLGEVTQQQVVAEDVTAQHRDTTARLATMEAGVKRLRALVQDAKDLEDIALLESDLAARETDLDGVRARLQALDADVQRSTLTVNLADESEQLAKTDDATGFVAGLSRGWEAFQSSLTGVLTVGGAALPFLLALAVLLSPVAWWWRRHGAVAGPGQLPRSAVSSSGSDPG